LPPAPPPPALRPPSLHDALPILTYLIASPLLNPIIVGGIGIIFGWTTAIVYTLFTLAVSLLAPWVWRGLGLEKALKRVRVHGERSEEHTSELQSRFDLVCRLLLE